jgi:predicted enzyme related to lactoylglutathione lyase
MTVNVEKLKSMASPKGMDFRISKLGHIVLQVSDLERSTAFYTQVLGFKVSDVYPEEMMPGGMVFLRCNTDHHCLALVGAGDGKNANRELHHLAFEVPTLAEVIRARACARMGPRSTSKVGAAPVARSLWSFATRIIILWKFTGASIKSAAMAGSGPPVNGTA